MPGSTKYECIESYSLYISCIYLGEAKTEQQNNNQPKKIYLAGRL